MLTEQEIKALQERNEQLETINKEVVAERATLKEELKVFKQAEAEAKAAEEAAKAKAEQEALIQAEVEKRLKELNKDTIEAINPVIVEDKPEETKVDEQTEEQKQKELEKAKIAASLRL